MELYERQQFDFLLLTAVERYLERITQRNDGAENALRKLRENPQSEGIWLDEFVDAIFKDFLLDNVGGACFVLNALSKKSVPASFLASGEEKVEALLVRLAKQVFREVFRQKTEEALEQTVMYSGGIYA